MKTANDRALHEQGDPGDAFFGPQGRRRRGGGRQRILRSTSVLPSLVTVLNGLSGFAAIHFATKDALGSSTLGNLALAGWLVLAAMVFDMLDGRLARITRKTTEFGAQLDSLCDVISFGVAPAMLMIRTAIMALREKGLPGSFAEWPQVERVFWCVAGVYVACAALRLARFNVESEPDESAHMHFRGLPSPGAAAVVVAVVLLAIHLLDKGWVSEELAYPVLSLALPILTLAAALMMVSRFDYPHVVNQYIRGKRPFSYLVKLVILVLAGLLEPFITGAALALVYGFSGPARAGWRRALGKPRETPLA